MTPDVLRLMLNNIQGQFNLQVGMAGAWNSLADARLLELLEKPKKKRGGKALAIEDTDMEQAPQLAIADAPVPMGAEDTAPQEDNEEAASPSKSSTASSLTAPGYQYSDVASCVIITTEVAGVKYKLRVLPEPAIYTNVDIIIHNTGDGCMDVVKVIYLEKTISSNARSGHGFCAVKKATQWALARMCGRHVHWHELHEKSPDKSQCSLQKANSSQWSPENDDLAEGVRYINSFAPECDALNEQTFWILTNIKPDCGSPVAGWPEMKVRLMCQNKARGVSGAVPHNEFPLNTYSPHPGFAEHILPLIYPFLMSTAVLMLGCQSRLPSLLWPWLWGATTSGD
ncbi:unnamed protein product [Effrenium voratum]|nr:unnamed protein product [Effrenium voratum]